MPYGEILSRAWEIIWRHKVLWIFGIFAGLSSGTGNAGSNNFQYQMDQGDLGAFGPALITLLCVGGLILFIVFFVLNVVSYVGLTRGAWEADEGAPRLSFGPLWRTGLRHFWRVAGLLLLVTLLSILLVAALVLPTVLGALGMASISDSANEGQLIAGGIGLVMLLLLCVCCIAVPLFMLVDAFVWQTVASIAGDNLTFGEGVDRAWGVVRNNLGQQILMALILAGIRIVIGFIVAIIAAIIAIPFGLMSGLMEGDASGMIVVALLVLPFSILLNGILQAYSGTVWTLVYRRLTGRLPGNRPLDISTGTAV